MAEAAKIIMVEGTKPTTPTTNAWAVYFKTDGLYYLDDAGTEVGPLTAADLKVTTKGDILGFSNVAARVPIGTDAQVLTADSAQPLGLKWATPTAAQSAELLDGSEHTDTLAGSVVRGDLIVGNATPKWSRLGKGAANQVLTMNAGATDPEWAAATGGASPFAYWVAEAGIAYSANPAAFGTSGDGTGYLAFDDSTNEEIVFRGFAHSSLGAGDLTVTLTWYSATATSGDAKWDVKFERQNTTLETASFATEQTTTTTVGGTVSVTTTTVITFTIAQADGLLAGESFRLWVSADAADGAHTIVGDVRLTGVTVAQ